MVDAYAREDRPIRRRPARPCGSSSNGRIDDMAPDELPSVVAEACAVLDRESGLGSAGEGAEPGADREPFEPGAGLPRSCRKRRAVSYGSIGLGGLLALPRILSFWAMKGRGRGRVRARGGGGGAGGARGCWATCSGRPGRVGTSAST